MLDPASENVEPPPPVGESWPYGFAMLATGFYWIGDGEALPLFLAAPFVVLGCCRDDTSGRWGIALSFSDPDSVPKIVILAAADMVGDGAAVRQKLAAAGLRMSTRKIAKDRFIEALAGVETSARVRLVTCTGWDADFARFAMPSRTFGGGERVVFDTSTLAAKFASQGTFPDWQVQVAAPAHGHHMLVFALAVAFTGPLLGVLGAEGAIWHFLGGSSLGKTTLILCGVSAWGPPALVGSWRATANGFEAVAAMHSDILLALDELGLADPRSLGDVIYLLCNGTSKTRMSSDGGGRAVVRFRISALSTGESSHAAKMSEAGPHRETSGQAVRVIELPIGSDRAMGVFDGTGSKEEAAAMSDSVKAAAAKSYGTAGPAFLEKLVADVDGARREARSVIDEFMANAVPKGVDGQVTRVARKFATVAAAGELAAKWNILPPCFRHGDVSEAAERLFANWLRNRGGTGATEDRQAVLRTKAFLAANASARMPSLRCDDEGLAFKSSFRAQMIAGYQDAAHFYLSDGGFKEALHGLDPVGAADALFRHGFLVKSADAGRRKTYVSTPKGRQRLYKISRDIMEFDDGI